MFAGVVDFLSVFCRDFQLLEPIYDLTRKGRVFHWESEQQEAFDEINKQLQKPPVLYMPDNKERFHIYCDTSKFVTGNALCKKQNVQPRQIAYASK